MLPQTLSAILPDSLAGVSPQTAAVWLAMLGFGAYHGLNPGMGWLFALSRGLQERSEQAIWRSLLPIAAGHALSLLMVAVLVIAGAQYLSTTLLQWLTALVLIAFGIYKLFNYYRHPRWVGMQVSMGDLVWWSFLMATAHGAGLMIAPALTSIATTAHSQHAGHVMPTAMGGGMALAIAIHMGAMLLVMALIAWVVYKKVGLAILRRSWVNFDLIWAAAMLAVGVIALGSALWPMAGQAAAV
jgi:hypothetical protein